MNEKRPSCTPQAYLEATTESLLKETHERREELLSKLDPKWRRAFRSEIARQNLARAEIEAGLR